jgi:hypothetical protein
MIKRGALADPELLHDGAFDLASAQQPADGIFGGLGNTRSADRPSGNSRSSPITAACSIDRH